VGAVASLYSDYRFRGASLSDRRPVALLDISYDAASGVYGAVSGSVVASRREGVQPLGLSLNAGYSRGLRSGLTADVGVVHARYSHYSALAGTRSYSEAYAGLSGKLVGARLSLSPNYVGSARGTVRGELNGHVALGSALIVDGAAGLLVALGGRPYRGSGAQWDARVGLAQRLSRVSLHTAVTARGGGTDIYTGERGRRVGLVFGVSTAL
jgi:hypothetical protein